MTEQSKIIGRYAPSPTGPLHLGNLRTALIAWLSARSQEGEFILRMEDLDTPRVVTGSADQILRDLEWLGIDWDGPVMYQSTRLEKYQQAMDELTKQQLVYPCYCSRKDIQLASSAPHGESAVYSGTCRVLTPDQQARREQQKKPSYRVIYESGMPEKIGDFVIKRADNLFAYQLAVVVDDLEQGVTEVVRGADLSSSTARQQYLMAKLAVPKNVIQYHHAPLLMDDNGIRMSKRNGSYSIAQWRQSAKTSEQLLALLVNSLDLEIKFDKISISELLQIIDICKLKALLV